MESQSQNPEFRINPENFHPCRTDLSRSEQASDVQYSKQWSS